MSLCRAGLLGMLISGALLGLAEAEPAGGGWFQLPALPDPEGFAGGFAGVAGGRLLFAGGANIVGEKWGTAFEKQ